MQVVPVIAVPQHAAQFRHKTGNFGLPVRQHRGRADDQRRALQLSGGFQRSNVRQGLHGFSKPHVVRQHATEPGAVERLQPVQPVLLIGAEICLEADRR